METRKRVKRSRKRVPRPSGSIKAEPGEEIDSKVELGEIVNSDSQLREEPPRALYNPHKTVPSGGSRHNIRKGNTSGIAKLFETPNVAARFSYAKPIIPMREVNEIENHHPSSTPRSTRSSRRSFRSTHSKIRQSSGSAQSLHRLQDLLKSIRDQRLLSPQKLKKYLTHVDKLAYLIIVYFILSIQSKLLILAIGTVLFKHLQKNIL